MQETVRAGNCLQSVGSSSKSWGPLGIAVSSKAEKGEGKSSQKAPALWVGLLQCTAADHLQVKLLGKKECFVMREVKFYRAAVSNLSRTRVTRTFSQGMQVPSLVTPKHGFS